MEFLMNTFGLQRATRMTLNKQNEHRYYISEQYI